MSVIRHLRDDVEAREGEEVAENGKDDLVVGEAGTFIRRDLGCLGSHGVEQDSCGGTKASKVISVFK